MKKLIFLLALCASVRGFSQAPDTTRPQQKIFTYIEYQNIINFNTGLRIPQDTFKLRQKDSGSVAYKGSTLMIWNGNFWGGITANVAGKLNISDTSGMLLAYRNGLNNKINLTDTGALLINYRNALNSRVKYSDTAAMLNNYQSALTTKVKYSDTSAMLLNYQNSINNRPTTTQFNNAEALNAKYTDTSAMLTNYRNSLNGKVLYTDTSTFLTNYRNAINARIKYTDSSGMLTPYQTGLNNRVNYADTGTLFTNYRNAINARLKISDTAAMFAAHPGSTPFDTTSKFTAYQNAINARVKYTDTTGILSTYQAAINARLKISDTAAMFAAHPGGNFDTTSKFTSYQNAINARVKYTDTTGMLASYITALNNRVRYSDTSTILTPYQNALNSKATSSGLTSAQALDVKYTDTSSMLLAYKNGLNGRSLTGHTHSGADITSGTVADARLSSNVALKNIDNSFSTGQHITGNLTVTGNLYSAGSTADVVFEDRTNGSPSLFYRNGDLTQFGGLNTGASAYQYPFTLDHGSPTGALQIGSAGLITMNQYGAGFAKFSSAGLISSAAIAESDLPVLTGYTSGAGTVAATDTYRQAIQKINGNQAADAANIVTNTSAISTNATNAAIATNLTSGTVADARLSTNVPLLNAANAFTNNQTITKTTEQFRTAYDGSNYVSHTVSSAGVKTETAVGTAPQFVFNKNIPDGVTLAIFNQANASSTGAIIDAQVNGSSKFNVSSGGTGTFAGNIITNGGTISSSGTVANANLYVGSSTGVFTSNNANDVLAGSSNTMTRLMEHGSTSGTLIGAYAYGSHIIGKQTIAEAASGAIVLATQLAVRPLQITNAAGTTTDAATLYVEGPQAGVTPTGFDDALRVKAGTTRLQGGLSLNRTTVADAAYTMLVTDYLVAYTSLTATRAVTLPTGTTTLTNQHFVIKDEAGTAGTNNITIVGTVNGASNPTAINTNYGVYRLYYNGSNWYSE